MSFADLRRLAYPVVLYTRSDPGSTQYNHFVLYVESSAAGLLILDGAKGLRTFNEGDLAKIWGGVGLVISDAPINPAAIAAGGGLRLGIPLLGCAALVSVLGMMGKLPLLSVREKTSSKLRVACLQVIALAATASAGAAAYHRLDPKGFLASRDSTVALDQAYAPMLLPTITVEEARRSRERGATLVDARMAADFAVQHIPRSINVPVSSSDEARRSAMANVPIDAEIILFCKSPGCGYSTQVAKELLRDGYRNVKMFRGGWDEWVAQYGTPDA